MNLERHTAGTTAMPVEGNELRAITAASAGVNSASIELEINGERYGLITEARATLLDVLREKLGLAGTKMGCNHGQCGACTVHVDGRRVLACLTLAMTLRGSKIVTIEGVAAGDDLNSMQQAFIDHDAFQCGYCTSGQIMSALALEHEPIGASDLDVAEAMSGNLCRCGAYLNIVAAIQSVRNDA